jgi:hypothetical protein
MLAKEGTPVEETVQIMVQGSTNFQISPKIVFIDEETTQRPLKEIYVLDLVLQRL